VKRGPIKRDRKAVIADLFTATGIVPASSLVGKPPTQSAQEIQADRRRAAKGTPPTDAAAGVSGDDGDEPPPAKVLHLRDYQTDCEDAIFREWESVRATLVVMATGLGKTVVATRVCKRIIDGELGPRRRFLFLAHREELIKQAYDTFRAAFPRHRVEIERATDRASRHADVVIASNQTLGRLDRMATYPPDFFGGICQDEAHHAVASNATYSGLLKYFSPAKVLGLTATPDRKDELALGQIFDTVAFQFDIVDGVREGWLVPIGQRLEIVRDIDYSTVTLDESGEFTEADLARVMREEKNLYALADAAIKYSNYGGKTRPTLVFAASREHAIDVADILNAKHARTGTSGRAAAIHYKVDDARRAELVAAYKRGEIRYLTNFGILTEGFDSDETRVIVNGRPIHKNRALFAQIVGRATRPLWEILEALSQAPDAAARRAIIKASRKPGAMVVDLCGINHKLVLNMTDLLGGHYTEEAVSAVRERIAKSDEVVDVESELEKIQKKIDEQKAEDRRRKLRESVNLDVQLDSRSVDPFNLYDSVSSRGTGMRTAPRSSTGQIGLLERYGVPRRDAEELTKAQASKLIDTIQQRKRLGLCTYKQAQTLARYGYDTQKTFAEAKIIIDALAANRWQPIDLRE
jgi:superfamily II DNA or RNA helicase